MKRRGFTLLEVMVTTTILVLLVAASWPALAGYQDQLNLEDAALALQTCVNSAADYARAPIQGATVYTAIIDQGATTCTVQAGGSGSTVTELDSYSFSGLTINNLPANQISVNVRPQPPYTVVVSANPLAPLPSTIIITLISTSNSAVRKNLTLNLATGIINPT